MSFVHLHTHSPFSFLDGASSIEDLVNRAARLEMPAMAITDHNNVCAAVKFSRAAARAGIKAIQGVEVTLAGGSHLLLLARNAVAYASICSLLTRAHLNNPRLQPCTDLEELSGLHEVIALSGCRRGELASLILQGRHREAWQRARQYRDIFGRNNFYIEMQDTFLPGNHKLNRYLLQLAEELELEPVASNNVHYLEHNDFIVHDLLTCVRKTGKVQEIYPERPLNGENYLKSPAQMRDLFSFCPRAAANTLRLSEECQPVFGDIRPHFPRFEPVPGGDEASHLSDLVFEGALRRYGVISPAVRERLEYELDIIIQMGYAGYFLLVHDLVSYARRQGIRYAGRGSAADSLAAYCLFITEVDSLERRLLFERFMSPERSQLPDIDIDFEARRREEVIEYIYRKYGADRVARVAVYNTFRARSALVDIGKALGFDEAELHRITRKLPSYCHAGDIRRVIQKLPELGDSPLKEKRFGLLLDVCEKVAGFPRFLGTHLGGLVISDTDLNNFTPLQHSALGPVICQFDKDDVEDLGLVKLDLLSLRTLAVVQEVNRHIAARDAGFDYDSIDLNDPATYEMIARGETIGVFQLESPAQRALQARLEADNMEDMIASMALIRPGPIKGNMVEPYIARRQGREDISYPHPLLEPIVKKTYGVVLFQEQVIEIAIAVAGFTPGEADQLRRVMNNAHSQKYMEEIGVKFISRAMEKGIEKETAEEIFSYILGYASYGFCEAHAAAFAATSFKTAYLIRHYPAEYYTAILNQQPMGYYPAHIICNEARRKGIRILPPDINKSGIAFSLEDGSIRVGLKQVKGMSAASLQSIMAARRGGLFTSMPDAINRSRLKRDELENLIKCGAFDRMHSNRRRLLASLPQCLAEEQAAGKQAPNLFPGHIASTLADFSAAEKKEMEYRLLGMDVQEHFMAALRSRLQKENIKSSRDLQSLKSGMLIKVAGLLLLPHRPPTRSGKITVFFSLEDEFGLIDVTVFEDVYMQYGQLIFTEQSAPLLISGRLQKRGKGNTVIAHRICRYRWNEVRREE